MTYGDLDAGYIVAYAKISIDKEDGINLQGVFFGGIGQSNEEAEQIARECVNTIKGKTVLPKVIKLTPEYNVIDALYDAYDRFEEMTAKMREADDIINRENRRK